MHETVTAPERTNRHAVATSARLSPTMWNSSARTAAEVARGSGRLANAATHGRCHRSSRSSRARIAPVSIRPLAGTAPREARAHRLPHLLRAACVATVKRADEPRCRPMQATLLRRVLGPSPSSSVEPAPDDPLEQAGDAGALPAGGVLQRRLHLACDAPAVDLVLRHALHRSAAAIVGQARGTRSSSRRIAGVASGPGRRSAPDEELREEDLARGVARDPDAGQVVWPVDVLPVRPALEPPSHRLGRGVAMAPVGGDVLGGPPAADDPTESVYPIGEPAVSEARPALCHGQAVQPGLSADALVQGERGEAAGAPVLVHQLVDRAFERGVGTRNVGSTGRRLARGFPRRTIPEGPRAEQAG